MAYKGIPVVEWPKGYNLWDINNDHIIVVMTDFLLMCRDAEPFLGYKGKLYKRGLLECIPDGLGGDVCSARRYDLVES